MATLVSTFLLFFAGPSDPAQAMCPETKCNPAAARGHHQEPRARQAPDRSSSSTYFKGLFVGRDFVYAGDTVHCGAPCLGFSFVTRRSVNEELFTRFPNTVVLALMAAVVFVTVGVTLGIFAAVRRGSADRPRARRRLAGARRHPVLRPRAARRALPGHPVERPAAVLLDIGGSRPLLHGHARAGVDPRASSRRLVRALHPQLDDRDPVDGLHPHGTVQGHPRAHGPVQARLPRRDEPDRHDPGPRHRRAADRHAHHRADLRCRRIQETGRWTYSSGSSGASWRARRPGGATSTPISAWGIAFLPERVTRSAASLGSRRQGTGTLAE